MENTTRSDIPSEDTDEFISDSSFTSTESISNKSRKEPRLNILYTNAQSVRNKMDELRATAIELNPCMIGITESWTNNQTEQCLLIIPGYAPPIRQDRVDTSDGRGGGVLLYLREDLSYVEIHPSTQFTNSVWISLSVRNNHHVTVGVVYRSPNSDTDNNENLVKLVDEMCSRGQQIIVMGDFNYPNIDWILLDSDSTSTKFLDVVQDNFLTQHVSFGTRKDNTLDIILTSEADMCQHVKPCGYLGSSDHLMLSAELILETIVRESVQWVPDYRKANFEGMRRTLQAVNWIEICSRPLVENAWEECEGVIKDTMKKCIPLKRRTQRRKPFQSRKVTRAIRKKRKAWLKYNSSQDPDDKFMMLKAEKFVKTVVKQEAANLERDIAKKSKTNPKLFHQFVRSKLKTKATIGPITDSSGQEVSSDVDAAEIFNQYFASVFTREQDVDAPELANQFLGPEVDPLGSVNITEEMVKEKIMKLDVNKASGPDEISTRFLIESVHEITNPLANLFNRMLHETYVPNSWKVAVVTPIHKKGSRNLASNYRPVSLTSQMSKLFESLLRDVIVDHLETKALLRSSQHGFRRKRSCLTNLLEFLNDVTSKVDSGSPVDVIYLDFQKAFDKIPHKRLFMKMLAHGISGDILSWFTEWMSDRRQRVSVNGQLSGWKQVTSGVPQGSVLGPVAFLVYINDIDLVVQSSISKFADDTKIYRCVDTAADIHILQEDLDNLVKWSNLWQMSFNEDKCKVMHIGYGNERSTYIMNEQELESTSEEKDLGVIVSDDLKPSKQCAAAVSRANRVLGTIKWSFNHRDKDLIKDLYISRVRPLLEHAVQAWSPQYKKDAKLLEGVQRRATKLVPELRNLEYEERLEQFGLTSLVERRTRGDMLEVHKIMTDEKYCNSHMLTRSHNSRTRGHSQKLEKQKFRLNTRRHFFADRVVDDWNRLPEHVVT